MLWHVRGISDKVEKNAMIKSRMKSKNRKHDERKR